MYALLFRRRTHRCSEDCFNISLLFGVWKYHRLLSGEYNFYWALFFWFVDFVCCLLLPFAHPHIWTLLFLMLFHLSGNLLFQHVFEVQVVPIVDFHIGQ